jgi:CspA family cold shock protein
MAGYTPGWRPFGNREPDGRNSIISGNSQMAEGTIKKLTDKGYGFIKTAGTKDLFFHSSAVQGVTFEELREGQDVSYTEAQGKKGPCAENVKPL